MRVRGAALATALLASGCASQLASAGVPECEPSGELVTIAQSVPSARAIPCIRELPIGWSFSGLDVGEGRSRFWLGNDRAGARAVSVTLEETCDARGATELPPEGPPTRRFLRVDQLAQRNAGAWLHLFAGGCVTYAFTVPKDTYDFDAFNVELDAALDFFPRSAIAEEVRRRYDAELDHPTVEG